MQNLLIAVVEDDSEDSEFFCTALEENYNGLKITVFNSGSSFLDYIDSDRELPDLVVTDLRMPLVSGFDVISGIRNNFRMKNVPVVVLSTSDSSDDKERAADLGVVAYFVKPYTFHEYHNITTEIIEGLRQRAFAN